MGNKINVKDFGMLHPYVIYHNDMDGKASAWLLHDHFAKLNIPDCPSDYQHFNYDGEIKKGSLERNRVTYIVDLSFTENTYHELLQICNMSAYVIWIDHHDSSVELLKNHPEILNILNLAVFVSKDACASILTYIYLDQYLDKVRPLEDNYQRYPTVIGYAQDHYNHYDPERFRITEIVTGKDECQPFIDVCIDDYTTCIYIEDWLEMVDDHDRYCLRNPNTRAFIQGVEIEGTSIVYKTVDNKIEFNSSFWGYLDSFWHTYVVNGELILKYQDIKASEELGQCFEWKDPETGVTIICKNDRGSSYKFLNLYNLYDAVCLFRYDGKVGKWFYSFYGRTDSTFNCAELCQRYGGGGHFHAAGCSTKKLIFDI